MPSEICLNLAWITTATPTPTTTEATMRLRAARSIAYFRDLDTESNTCKRLCERLFNRIVDDSSSCTLTNDRKCFFKSCRYIIGDVADLDDYEECPSICYSMSDGMHYLYLPVPLTMKAVRNICNTFDFPENTRKPRRTTESTTAVTYPKKQVFDCTELCEHVYPEILERYKYLCPVREKKLYYCVLSSCKEVINRTVMDDGRDPKDACPKMCLSMATAMLSRNMDRRLYGKENINEFCLKNVSSETTTKSPIITAVTYSIEMFSNCKELCEIVLPKTLRPHEYICQEGGKNYNPCVFSTCKEVFNRTVMDDGRDPKDACPKMCLSMAAAMLGRNMDRRLYGKEDVSEFCSSIDSTTKTTTESPADMVTQVW
ncbi:hypothetical protein NECAME_13004 [Necator americanus]|uniref:Uncharacterized protein n=1 Tax=Necator americanus TaxID=51031 RepID=W2SY15_NECAM|nr:hypothetical protein NECAME_13004 [Necator americanus]ETN74428.1 hypothetical protein NECAME_13004 [Necator americanus]